MSCGSWWRTAAGDGEQSAALSGKQAFNPPGFSEEEFRFYNIKAEVYGS